MTNDKKDDSAMPCLVAIGLAVLLYPVLALLYGWILSLYWVWFITPLFPVKPIGILQCAGLSCFVSFFTWRVDAVDKKYHKPAGEQVCDALVRVMLLLSMGYLLHLWISHA